MKKILIILALVTGLAACHNQEWDFANFDYTTGYFPYQFPVRTLVLGDYIFDNTNDNNHMFRISVGIGGVYTNDRNRVFNIELAPELCNNILFGAGKDTIRLMPQSYYTLSSATELIVPKGEVNGGIDVHLNDAFFDDTLAYRNGYVIPIRLVGSEDVDSILRGKSNKTNPDPRISTATEWTVLPKNFTMFAVKFVNPYHGKYLHRGVNTVKDGTNAILETNVYHKLYNVSDEIWSLVTTGKNKVTVTGSTHSTLIPGNLQMDISFDNNGNCTIAQSKGATYTISGTGAFKTDADSWGDKPRDAIHINYQITSGGNTYAATDTLVIRDRAVIMEVFSPAVFVK